MSPVPTCPTLTGLGWGEAEQGRLWGQHPFGLAQRLSSDAILWCSHRGPSLPDAVASLHVLCSLCHDLWPLRSSLAAARLLVPTPGLCVLTPSLGQAALGGCSDPSCIWAGPPRI